MRAFAGALICVCIFSEVYADYITGDIIGDIYGITQNTIIASDAVIYFNEININAPVYIENHGQIFGVINICDECKTYIRNNGTVHDIIKVGKNSSVVQVIVSNNDIKPLNVNSAHEILIYNTPSIKWGDVVNFADGANAITIVDSVLYLSSDVGLYSRAKIPSITLVGENKLYLSIDDIVDGHSIMQNISAQGRTHLHISDLNPLYAARAVIRDGNLYADIVRETDYVKIMDNDTGEFLNALRLNNPSDKLLAKLDAATDIGQINHILGKSMRINTQRMNLPLKTLARHMRINNIGKHLFQAKPFVIFGPNISAYGASAGINIHASNHLSFAFDAYGATMAFSDTIEDYTGDFVGLNVAAQYSGEKLYARMNAGANLAYLETPAIKIGHDMRTNPCGNTAYIGADIGHQFQIANQFNITPFIGITHEYAKVINADNDTNSRIGMIAEYNNRAFDLNYSYGIQISASTQNMRYISAYIAALSPDDDMTIQAAFGMMREEIGYSYHISASSVFSF